MEKTTTTRIGSIDTLRGLTILIMIFVNDLAGVQGVPAWMKHVQGGIDGMTFVDWVFPSFLFVVGMSIPFAIGGRMAKGESMISIWKHIVLRSISLLIIGVLILNAEEGATDGIIDHNVWALLIFLGIIMIWNNPKEGKSFLFRYRNPIRYIGIFLLTMLVLVYRKEGSTGFFQIKTGWWGIIGLIGWAYFAGASTYILVKRNQTALIGLIGLLYCFFLGMESGNGLISQLSKYLCIGNIFSSHTAIVVSGVVLGNILTAESVVKGHNKRIPWGFLFGLGLFIAGISLHSLNAQSKLFIIYKNYATVPWCLLCSAYTTWLWTVIYWITDVKGWIRWTFLFKPAGSNALFAYLLDPIFFFIFAFTARFFNGHNYYAELGSSFEIGIWRSIFYAFALVWLTAFLQRINIRLKL